MKFLYRFNSAPAGRYYSESWARENLPVRQMDRNVGKHLHCGILWYDKNNQPWVVVNRVAETLLIFPELRRLTNFSRIS